jgi:hypothetical protein
MAIIPSSGHFSTSSSSQGHSAISGGKHLFSEIDQCKPAPHLNGI